MAFATKYYVEWTDIKGLDWRVDLEKDGSFTAVAMQAMYPPLRIEFLSSTDDILQDPIKGSIASVIISSDTNFQWSEFYAVGAQEYRMRIYYNNGSDHLFWSGYVISDNYSEPYDGVSYSTTISASCGLGSLKNMLYKYQTTDPDDTYYNGRILESQIILDILGKLGITTFAEFINIYESNMDSTVDDSPMDQCKLDADVFKDMHCYDVLTEILNKYNANIKIINGIMTIYRPRDLNQITVYGRIFTAATTKTSTTNTPEQFFNRTTVASDIMDVEGGTLMIKSPAKKVTINQDYGSKESWIDTWEFKAKDYNITTSKFAGWTYTGGVGITAVCNIIPEESDGVPLPSDSDYPAAAYNVSQSFGAYIKVTGDIIGFSFDYLAYNQTTAIITAEISVGLKSDSANHWLYGYNETESKWSGSAAYITITEDCQKGNSGWKTWSTKILEGIPTDGTYTIRLYTPYAAAGLWVVFKNIRFFSTSDKIEIYRRKISGPVPKFITRWILNIPKSQLIYFDNKEIIQKQYVKTNAINGSELEYDCLLGDVADTNIDNVLEQFAGSLALVSYSGGSGAVARVDEFTKNSATEDTTVRCNGHIETMIWNTDESTSIIDFIASFGSSFGDVTLAHSGTDTHFTVTANVAGVNFVGPSSIADGSVVTLVANDPGTAPSESLVPTMTWSSREPGAEIDPLLDIIAEELKVQQSRPRQYISIPVIDGDANILPHVNLIGNFQDDLNIDESDFYIKTTAGWTLQNCTLTLTGGYVYFLSTNTDPFIKKTGLSFNGNTHKIINVRYQVIAGTPGSGYLYYGTAGHGRSASYYKLFALNNDGDWHTLLLDMSSLTVGGTDWIDSIITDVWFDLTENEDIEINLDWIGFDRKYVFNRGMFNVVDREWEMDLVEII